MAPCSSRRRRARWFVSSRAVDMHGVSHANLGPPQAHEEGARREKKQGVPRPLPRAADAAR
jgi:hypothetical protein